MAAGLGFKDFTTGEVLTAADVDGYLMQGIWVFASAAARDAAVTSPQEGNACYLKDTNQVLTYSGSAWVAVGGGSPLTTKGDLYTFSTVDARLGVGANGTTLVADSSEATGLKWAAPASGALTKISKTSFSGAASYSISDCFSATYDSYLIMFTDWVNSTGDSNISFLLRSGSTNQTSNYDGNGIDLSGASLTGYTITTSIFNAFHTNTDKASGMIYVHNPFASKATTYEFSSAANNNPRQGGGVHTTASSYASLGITISANTSSGDVTIYGYSI